MTANHIRRLVKSNPTSLVDKLNGLIRQIRAEIRASGQYGDRLFIFDGTEKVDYSKYRELLVDNYAALNTVNAHVISAVPISALYELEHSAQLSRYRRVLLPMFKVESAEQKRILSEVITRRVDRAAFIEEDALALAVQKSGGCARQLLNIASNARVEARSKKVEVMHVEKAIYRLGFEMKERLDRELW